MSQLPNQPEAVDQESQAVLTQLRRKQGNWLDWAQACQALQKSGIGPQQIFEETGFEPIHQNQIIVAAQVYRAVANSEVAASVKEHFAQRGSDQLYEMRILSQADRPRMAAFVYDHSLDADEVKDLVKPVREYSYRKELPEGFSEHPGDAIAYHFWNLARQKNDLQERSRLIAQGLRFVQSPGARQQIEQLLTDFTVVKSRPAPSLPLYRLESESELPRIVPVAGQLPLSVEDFKSVPVCDPEEPFGLVKFSGTGAWVAVPGWQVILQAEDPVGVLVRLPQLPNAPQNAPDEQVLVVCDRTQREWHPDSYYLANIDETIEVRWFESEPQAPIVARIILVLRPKKILDEGYTRELWQLDE